MTVRVYESTDASAPSLSGTAGSLIGVLDACLVTGYGSKLSSGWEKAYTGTNLAAYRAPAGNRHYLRVDDSPAQYPRVRGYEAMTDVNTGTGLFPTDSQLSGGAYLAKSSTADATARGWLLVANDRFFMLFIANASATIASSSAVGQALLFGDLVSFKAGDAFNSFIAAGDAGSLSASRVGQLSTAANAAAHAANFVARSYTQTGGSIGVNKTSNAVASQGATSSGTSGYAYPDPVTGGIQLARVFVNEPTGGLCRGKIPGLWSPLHTLPAAPGDTFSGTGDLFGRTFIMVDAGNLSTRCRYAVETSNTWS
jgi:hypothetical protein